MRFLTNEEAKVWCADRVPLAESGLPTRPAHSGTHARGPVSPTLAFAQYLERSLQPRDACLLWVTTWGVWRSSENLHLYYRLRQSYQDFRLLDEAPAHLFLSHEAPDLVSFLQVGVLSGWDMHLIPAAGYARAFVSHDEFVEFAADDANPQLVHEFASDLGGAQVIPSARSA